MNTMTRDLIAHYGDDPLKLLESVDGYYEAVKDPSGKRLTPLVGYAGKYQAEGGNQLQYVGDVYINFAKAEEHPDIMHHLTKMLWRKMNISGPLQFVGPQMGGVSVGQFLALHASEKNNVSYACAEKIVTQLKTDTLREQSELQFARHGIQPGPTVIVEDVLNNFSTTRQTIELIEKNGGNVVRIVGLLNRSMTISTSYLHSDFPIPVVALVNKPFLEYKQDDPEVINDIKRGNVILKPKNEWKRLTDSNAVLSK